VANVPLKIVKPHLEREWGTHLPNEPTLKMDGSQNVLPIPRCHSKSCFDESAGLEVCAEALDLGPGEKKPPVQILAVISGK
jgi:hypothetical protein